MDKESTTETWDSGRGGTREGAGRPKQVQLELPSSIFPPNTERDREFFAEFEYPVEMISKSTFPIEDIHSRLLKSPEAKIDFFKRTYKLLKAINEKGVDIQ